MNYTLTVYGNRIIHSIEEDNLSDLFYTYQAAFDSGNYHKAELVDNRTGEVLAYYYYDTEGGKVELHAYLCPMLAKAW